MRIIRFIDADNAVHWGLKAEAGQASVLTGDLFDELVPTGEQVAVKKLLAPLAPTNIFCIGLNYREHAAESGLEPPRATRRLCQAHERGLRPGRRDPAASLLSPRPGG